MFLTRFLNQGPEAQYLRMGPSDINNEGQNLMTQQDVQRMFEQWKQQYTPPKPKEYYGPVKPPEYPAFADFGKGERGYALPEELTAQSVYDPSFMENLKDYATATGPSPWLQAQYERLDLDKVTGMEETERSRLGGLQEAREQLAMRRGLTTGAGERLEESGMLAKMFEGQRVSRDIARQKTGLELAEEEAKLGIMERLPGMELQRAGYETGIEQANIANVLAERERMYGAKQEQYKTQMAAWAAEQQAQATERAAGKPGLFGQLFGGLF